MIMPSSVIVYFSFVFLYHHAFYIQTLWRQDQKKTPNQEMNVILKTFLINLLTLVFCNNVDIAVNISESIFH